MIPVIGYCRYESYLANCKPACILKMLLDLGYSKKCFLNTSIAAVSLLKPQVNCSAIFYSPGVAGACSFVITWLSHWSFSSRSSKHHKNQTVRARKLKFWENVHPTPYVICHLSNVTYQVSPVMCHRSHVGKFLRDSQNICTINSFPIMNLKEGMTLNFSMYIGFC